MVTTNEAQREWPKRAEMLAFIHKKGDELWGEITACVDAAYSDGLRDGARHTPAAVRGKPTMETLAKWFAAYFEADGGDMPLARLRADCLLSAPIWPTSEPTATVNVDAEIEEIEKRHAQAESERPSKHYHSSHEEWRAKHSWDVHNDRATLLRKLRQPSPAKAATVTEVTREDVREVVYAWMNSDHTHLAAKLTWKPEQTEALIGAFMALLQQREA